MKRHPGEHPASTTIETGRIVGEGSRRASEQEGEKT